MKDPAIFKYSNLPYCLYHCVPARSHFVLRSNWKLRKGVLSNHICMFDENHALAKHSAVAKNMNSKEQNFMRGAPRFASKIAIATHFLMLPLIARITNCMDTVTYIA